MPSQPVSSDPDLHRDNRIPCSQTSRTIDLEGGGRLLFFEGWLGDATQRTLLAALSAMPWRQEKIRSPRGPINQPRLTAAFADPGVSYRYSGLTVGTHPWPPELLDLKRGAEREAGHAFNYALANRYRDGSDSIGFHADDESELGTNPVIASVSLGAARRFVLKHKRLPLPPVEVELSGGSLLVMAGTTQHHWRHGIPKTARPTGLRINLTFRKVVG
jgi:alkylated DNA repair dioxygenase AlkB